MEEMEVPEEGLHEQINEMAAEKKEEKRWSFYVAISTALMAVFAAVTSLLAGHHSNEALIEQIKASDQWAYYQAKGIKLDIVKYSTKGIVDSAALKKYDSEKKEIQHIAQEKEKQSEDHLQKHVTLSKAVTLFQIAIAISAISILSEKRFLWFVAIAISFTGIIFFAVSFF